MHAKIMNDPIDSQRAINSFAKKYLLNPIVAAPAVALLLGHLPVSDLPGFDAYAIHWWLTILLLPIQTVVLYRLSRDERLTSTLAVIAQRNLATGQWRSRSSLKMCLTIALLLALVTFLLFDLSPNKPTAHSIASLLSQLIIYWLFLHVLLLMIAIMIGYIISFRSNK